MLPTPCPAPRWPGPRPSSLSLATSCLPPSAKQPERWRLGGDKGQGEDVQQVSQGTSPGMHPQSVTMHPEITQGQRPRESVTET